MAKPPLVSVIIHNFNYGRYLRQCLESVAEQTYEHIEIMFSDNDSTDDSWKIMLEFDEKYPGKFSIAKNRRNVGAYRNFKVWASNLNGDFWFNLCSDDYIEKNFIELAMKAFEKNPDSHFLMAHRTIIDENENEIVEAPFFNQSCVLHPPGLSLLYMKAVLVTTNSQMIYRINKTLFADSAPTGSYGVFRTYFGPRFTDFMTSMRGSLIYLAQPLVKNRVHANNHGKYVEEHMLDVIGAVGLAHEFREIAQERLPEFAEDFDAHLEPSIEKHARTALRYSARCLKAKKLCLSRRYVHLAIALSPMLEKEELTVKLLRASATENFAERESIVNEIGQHDNLLYRKESYEPTEPYDPLIL